MAEINNPVNVSYADERNLLQVKYVEYMLPTPYKVDYSLSGFQFTRHQSITVAEYALSTKVSDIGNLVNFNFNIKYTSIKNGNSISLEDYIVSGIIKQSSVWPSVLYCGAIYDSASGEIIEGEPLDDPYIKGVSVSNGGPLAPLSVYLNSNLLDDPTSQLTDIQINSVEYLSHDEVSPVGADIKPERFDNFIIRISSINKIVSMSVDHSFGYDNGYNDRRVSELVLNSAAHIYIHNTNLFELQASTIDIGRRVDVEVFENYIDISFSSPYVNVGAQPVLFTAVIPRGFNITSRGNIDDLTINVVRFSID